MQIYECINECKNEYMRMLMLRMNIWGMSMLGVNVRMLGENFLICAMLGVNVSSECRNVRSECFDRCKYMNEC